MSELLAPMGTPTSTDHPVEILMREHELLLDLGVRLREEATALVRAGDPHSATSALHSLTEIQGEIRRAQSHYVREENVIFPYLEKHGVVQPPMIMWSEHDMIRAIEKRLDETLRAEGESEVRNMAAALERASGELAEMFASHFQKENSILFPMALRLFTEQEWADTERQFAELGYWKVVPASLQSAVQDGIVPAREVDGEVAFATGALPIRVIEKILDTLPVDVTFVDADDRVKYFSNGADRVFPRTEAIIGRKVQQCHPEKSVHVVNQILEDFRNGRRDTADFWIQSGGKFILIRYFAVRQSGEYLGCLEVTQDATGVRALEGEKRLL